MDVKDRLSCITVGVEDCTESTRRNTSLFRNHRRASNQFADELIVANRQLVQRRDVSLGDDQDVGRRLRVDVVEGDHVIVFMDD